MPAALEGLRALEFGAALAGPWIGRFLAYCGAEVIRVESKNHPDVVRLYVPPRNPELGTQPQLSPWFTDWNAGKRFAALNLSHPEAVELARALVAKCDVVIENLRGGVMEKLGLGYAELRRVKPDLIMLGSTGYGDSGPCRRYVTWGSNIEALSGLSTLSGFPERECTITQFAYPDPLSALHGLFAVTCALDHRARTGRGQHIDLSQLEASVAALGQPMMQQLAGAQEPRRLGNRSLRAAPHGVYPCRGEDRWCAIAVFGDADWERLCGVPGNENLASDARFASHASRLEHADALDERIDAWTRERDAHQVMHVLQRAGIAAGVAQNVEDLYRRDPQLAARGFFERIEHLKKGPVVATGIPVGLTATPGRSGPAGAALGRDNAYVFGSLLGLSPERIRRLVETGAIEEPGAA